MWKNFRKALEKRVKKSQQGRVLPDRFMIKRVAEEYLLNNYGKEGLKNVKIELSKNQDYVIFKCRKAIWKTELRLNEEKIVQWVNEALKTTVIKKCFFN